MACRTTRDELLLVGTMMISVLLIVVVLQSGPTPYLSYEVTLPADTMPETGMPVQIDDPAFYNFMLERAADQAPFLLWINLPRGFEPGPELILMAITRERFYRNGEHQEVYLPSGRNLFVWGEVIPEQYQRAQLIEQAQAPGFHALYDFFRLREEQCHSGECRYQLLPVKPERGRSVETFRQLNR